MTVALEQVFTHEYFTGSPAFTLVDLFVNVVKPLTAHLDALAVARFLEYAVEQASDLTAAIALLKEVEELVKADPQAPIYINATLANVYTRQQRYFSSEAVLSKCSQLMTERNVVIHQHVNAAYFKAAAALALARGDTAKYAQHSLLHLSYIELDSLSPQQKHTAATALALATALGASVFDIGEALQHPALEALDPKSVLAELLLALSQADIAAYGRVMQRRDVPADVAGSKPFLDVKIRLLALMALVRARPVNARVVTVKALMEALKCSEKETRELVVRGVGSGLLRATVDDQSGTVCFDWVAPRVLDRAQVQELATVFREAASHVKSVSDAAMESVSAHSYP
jgi:hypothetical protein